MCLARLLFLLPLPLDNRLAPRKRSKPFNEARHLPLPPQRRKPLHTIRLHPQPFQQHSLSGVNPQDWPEHHLDEPAVGECATRGGPEVVEEAENACTGDDEGESGVAEEVEHDGDEDEGLGDGTRGLVGVERDVAETEVCSGCGVHVGEAGARVGPGVERRINWDIVIHTVSVRDGHGVQRNGFESRG